MENDCKRILCLFTFRRSGKNVRQNHDSGGGGARRVRRKRVLWRRLNGTGGRQRNASGHDFRREQVAPAEFIIDSDV